MDQRLVGVAQVIGVRLQAPQLHADAVQLERQVVHLHDVRQRLLDVSIKTPVT